LADRPVLAGAGRGKVQLWDLQTRQQLATLAGHPGMAVFGLAWGQLADRPVLASAGGEGTVRLWDPQTREKLATLTGHTGMVRAVVWGRLADRPVLASGSYDETVRLWDPRTGQELATLTGHTGSVDALAWGQLADRPVLASGSRDGAWLWDPETGLELVTLTGHTGSVYALAWGQLADRPVLASGSDQGIVGLWAPMIEQFEDRLPGYRSDDPTDPDRLGRDAEAIALAELITAQSARPPLAIGLFGDWGEGKSHFLGRIADHVQRRAAQAPQDDVLTHSAVRQVRFNAWHYAETDLWASLVTELFSQLATGPGDPGMEERRQSRLAAELAARRHLPERLRAAQDRKQALQQELEKQPAGQGPLRWLDPQQQARLAGLAGDQPEQVYRSLRSTASGMGSAARSVQRLLAVTVRYRWFWLGLLLVAAASVVALVAPGLTAQVVSTVAALAALLGTALMTVRSSLKELKDQAAPWMKAVQQQAKNRRQRLETALEVATAEVSALEAERRELTPTGQLGALVERRGRQDSPYRARLGLMTQIREDFEQMARLLAAPPGQQTVPIEDEVGDQLPRIDRIVVYIDDLDRCPPARVVEVLEAVHLLLAVPLFVVVVAVDPRWLLRSLTVHYRELLGALSRGSESDDTWGSTPMQYLEKIFQIPFTLPPVDRAGYTTLVDALTDPTMDAGRSAPTDAATNPALSAIAAPPSAGPSAADGPTQPRPLPSVPVVERFDPLALTEDERRMLTLLGPPLVTTPRSVKRLVNSYGLLNALRGSQHVEDLREITHSTGSPYFPYRSAMTLLATLIAFPSLSPTLFVHLHRAGSNPQSSAWTQFLKQAEPQLTDDSWSSDLVGSLTTVDAQRWIQLVDALQQLTTNAADAGLPLPEPMDVWADWVVPVGRLSFETGRAVVAL
jgi:hypothetical protein